ncbi:hypothetical protein [Agromyces bauzanensis]|uniref:Uncharacterized protein n=1 Tax=Agromyces bauzanensis TaxID=1308924 RepID=A0A917PN52_9MICO|nr:hypothetical protein [Agromyces bauzanensis]GGJ85791.1 hypothetical protein GCM10011372_25150 [Agromyces bauzanensis]
MFSRTMTNIGAGIGLAAAISLGSGMAAYAHDCYVPNRSAQGNAGVSNSQAWFTLYIPDALAGDVANGVITTEQADCIFDLYTQGGGPEVVSIMYKGAAGQGGLIGANNPNDWLMSNGTGVDHFFDTYGGLIFGSYEACGASFPV